MRHICDTDEKLNSTISFIIFWDFLMFYQIFFSPQVKRCPIITYKHGIKRKLLKNRKKTFRVVHYFTWKRVSLRYFASHCRSMEYKNYPLVRDYKPSIVNKHPADASTLSRQQARQNPTNQKSQVSKNVTPMLKYNPRLPDHNSLLKKHMPLL